MAVLRPSLHELGQLATPLNDGEQGVAEALSTLDDGWTVYVQPRIGQDQPDFVAVHDERGVCAIEVKDWSRAGYRQNDHGGIEYRDAAGWHASPELPRYQAHRYRATIFDQFFALPDDAAHPSSQVRAAVVLPQYTSDDARRLLHHAGVNKNEGAVAVWGGDGLKRCLEEIVCGRGCDPPNPASVMRLRRHLAESHMAADLRRPVKLSADARNIESNPSSARVRRVRGPAGCGKSFGLAARAARLAVDHKRVLVLSYNVTLANYLRTLVNARCQEYGANPTLVTCVHFHGLCGRLVDDAHRAGISMAAPSGLRSIDAVVAKAQQALAAGMGAQYDAVLVDEGQDFNLNWWNTLRTHLVVDGGEMLLVADPTQDVYEQRSWTDEDKMIGAGFSGPWTELKGSYRMPSDVVPLANAFASLYVHGDRIAAEVLSDHDEVVGRSGSTRRRWTNIADPTELGTEIGLEVVRLLSSNPDVPPRDVVFLCETHADGLAAVRAIEAAGHDVHHVFSEVRSQQQLRKRRFWPDADGVKGCTVHSFKGWETPALVMGIGRSTYSRRLAYVAMTRITRRGSSGTGLLSVVNSDLAIAGFQSTFEIWAPPRAELRVG